MPSPTVDETELHKTLASAVGKLRDAAVGDLDTLKRYWVDSRIVWKTHGRLIASDAAWAEYVAPFLASGIQEAKVNHWRTLLTDTAARTDGYLTNELPSFVVQRVTGIHEELLLGLVRAFLLARPRHLIEQDDERPDGDGTDDAAGSKPRRNKTQRLVPFKRLPTTSREEIIAGAVEKLVRNLAYKSLPDQYDRLAKVTKSEGCRPAADDVTRLAELIVTRNALVHAGGVAGPEYAAAAGDSARVGEGERLPLDRQYVDNALALVRRVVEQVAAAARAKAGDAPARG